MKYITDVDTNFGPPDKSECFQSPHSKKAKELSVNELLEGKKLLKLRSYYTLMEYGKKDCYLPLKVYCSENEK